MAEEYNKMLLNTWDELLSKFGQDWTYPERPILTNQKYPYRLLHCNNPGDFALLLDDDVTLAIERLVKDACAMYSRRNQEYNFSPVEMKKLAALGSNVEMVPVAVKDRGGVFYRGEINALKLEENYVFVTLVDLGVEKRVRPEDLFPPSTDLLRYPRLALICRLSQVVPEKKTGWPAGVDYKSIFMGGTEAKRTFSITSFCKGIYEVYLERDGVDLGYELVMERGVAEYYPLEYVTGYAKDLVIGKYPRQDFAPWVGQKLCAFGTKISRVSSTNPACGVKIHLQLDTTLANDVADKVQDYGAKLQKAEPTTDFPKNVGDPVIVLYEGEYYRATIVEVKKKFKVRLVDYGDFIPLDEKEMFPISEELANTPETSMPCYLVELQGAKLTDDLIDRLMEAVKEQNVFCRIGCTDFVDDLDLSERHKYIVTLSIPLEGKEKQEVSVAEFLNLPACEPASSFPTKYLPINRFLAPILLSPNSRPYVSGRVYEANLACVDSLDSVWIHLNGDGGRAEALTSELTSFYASCPELGNLEPRAALVGTFIGAQQELEPEDPNWYRAVITEVLAEHKMCKVKYLDYGNTDEVPIEKMKPLVKYFAKDQPLAVEVALPLTLCPGVNPDEVADIILQFMEGLQGTAYLQHGENRLLYAWLYVSNISLAETLVKSGKATLKLSPPLCLDK